MTASASHGERTIGVILQARMGSSRLPGKVLADINGRPMLSVLLDRLRSLTLTDQLIVATTDLAADDVIEATARNCGVQVYRGAESDVLDRYYRAAVAHGIDIIVRMTADNPFVDGAFVDDAVSRFVSHAPPADYVDTTSSGGYPKGMSLQIVTFDALRRAWELDANRASREHVLTYIRKNSEQFETLLLRPEQPLRSVRLTVDTMDDLTRARAIFAEFDDERFSWLDAVCVADRLQRTSTHDASARASTRSV